MRLRPILAALAGLTLLLGLVACGDDDGDDTASAKGAGPVTGVEGPALGEHWHVAYAIQVCGELLPAAADRGVDALGIHTHEDGLIHIHPFEAAAAGAEARLQVFLDQIGAQVGTDGIELADGAPDVGACDGDPVVRVGQWDDALDAADGADPDRIVTEDVGDIVLGPDLGALTIVVGPEDEAIQAPPATADICALASADGPTDHPSCGGSGDGDTPTTAAAESVAGEPCVAQQGDGGPEAPEVPVPVGPPPTDLVVEDLVAGDGAVAAVGDSITVDYVGVACSTGEVFDSSYTAGEPATFSLEPGSLIEGFATGIEGMAVGGRRLLVIPSDLAYGAQGSGPIAPDEALVFVVDLRATDAG
jgi:peptidylprolyl isomerase